MAIKLSDSIRVGQQKPLEDKYFNELVPYTSTTQVNTLIPKGVRHIGLTVNINKEEYWYKDGIEDSNLVLKINNIDTSNLVPYTGANKDVNIGAYYFKTSKGFVFTYDENNYFKTYYSSSYNHLGFYSEDSSNDNFGYMFIEANPEIGFVVNIANGDGIYNSFHATESRTYSEKPFVSSEGFIKTGGTPNQALTADGSTFDLNTKADLEAVVNETKKATITVELISQLTTNFYAPNALRINSTSLISGSGTLTLKVNDVAYTLGNLIPQGAKITAETTSSSVYNLISVYE